jgi:quinolinate synthase
MKTITPSDLLASLRHDRFEVTIPPATIERARLPIERMISLA